MSAASSSSCCKSSPQVSGPTYYKKTHCARKILVVLNSLTIFFALGSISLVLYIILSPKSALINLIPLWSLYVIVGASAIAVLAASLGLLGSIYKRKAVLFLFVCLVAAAFALETLILATLAFDFFEINKEIGINSYSDGLKDSLEQQFISFALSNPATWVSTQDQLSCCGYDFKQGLLMIKPVNKLQQYESNLALPDVKLLYNNADLPEYLDALHSGHSCTEDAMAEVVAIQNAAPNGMFDFQAQKYYEENSALTSPSSNFYCKEKIITIVEPFYLYGAIGAGVLMLIELLSLLSGLYLLMFVSSDRWVILKEKEKSGETTNLTSTLAPEVLPPKPRKSTKSMKSPQPETASKPADDSESAPPKPEKPPKPT